MHALAEFRSNRKNEILGFLLLSVAIIVFLSLASHNPMDTPAHTSAPNMPVSNAVGVVGAYVAGFLLLPVGIAAYLVPIVLLIWAWKTFWGKIGKDIYLKLTGLVIMLLSVSGLARLFDVSVSDSYFRAGGVVGPYVSDTLGELFGLMGARVVAFTAFLISILLTTEFLFVSFALML